MTELKKPPTITKKQMLLPLVAFAMAVAFVLLGLKAELPPGSGAEYVLPAIGCVSAAIGIGSIVLRVLESRRWDYVAGDGFALLVNWGGRAPEPDALRTIAENVFAGWSKAAKSWEVSKIKGRELIRVEFVRAPSVKINGREVAGYVTKYTRSMVVAAEVGKALGETAFAHELGHIIQGEATLLWDEDDHHDRARFFELS